MLVDSDAAAVWSSADLTGLSGSVSVLLIAFIGISLLFVARRYIRKSGVK